MFDPRVYRDACRELTAPEEKIEETIAMTENKTGKKFRRPLRTALAACAAAAMMVIGVAAANPEAAQEIFFHIASVIRVDEYRQDLTTEDGERLTVFTFPEATVENRGDRAILIVDGEEVDITKALAEEGSYTYERVTEGTRLVAEVKGDAENWEIELSMSKENGEWYGSVRYNSEEENALGAQIGDTGAYLEKDGQEAGASVVAVDPKDSAAAPKDGGTISEK